MATLTWLGHAAFRIDTDDGKRIYVDPFLAGNPKTPDSEKQPERVDIIAVTHGHSDHAGEVAGLSKSFPDAQIVAQVELKSWLGRQGANVGDLPGINKGGTQEIDGVRFTLTNAFHSSSTDGGEYAGESCGLVIRFDSKSIYFAGDTCVFGTCS
jgi:L-ascorbate metabolism protein UlaG (beta-lactamase superfamily)